MKNTFCLGDGLLCGRPGPASVPWDIDEIKDAGISAIVSLDQANVDFETIKNSGIEHLSVTLPDSIPPTSADEQLWIDALPVVLKFIDDRISTGRKVMVHCWAGKDRTGVLLGSYLTLVKGMEPHEAFKNVRKCRPVAMTSTGYENFFLGLMQKMLKKRHLFNNNNQQSS